ncbi:MAG: ribonuclease HII [Oceanospirillaceae bacterium]|nr:ribonuclease HII [Oceanospirillaceae bacterium]
MLDLEQYENIEKLAGCDEVGRGPLVGDVVAAAVILDPSKPIAGLADSKKLSEKKRDALYKLILENALCVSVGRASPTEIDQINILHASMLAMKRAIEGLAIEPQFVLVDGNRCPEIAFPCEAIVKGDDKVAAISAASIVAKVIRDAEMKQLHAEHPEYGFDRHKGYPTKDHMAALVNFGPLSMHRKSFKPVKALLS